MSASEKDHVETQTRPAKEKHVTPVHIIGDFDYVSVAGCEPVKWLNVNILTGRAGNHARFINQGIRQIRLDSQLPVGKGKRKRGVFMMFRGEYNQKVQKKVKEIIEGKWGADFAVLDNISELVDFINRRPDKKRMIQKLSLFSHGLVGAIEFGYETEWEDSYRLRAAQAKMLNPLAFDDDAVIYSYACRTGVGVDKEIFGDGDDPQYDKSLAQIIADHVDVHVMAFPRRSEYADTYGTPQERKTMTATQEKIKEYQRKMDIYNRELNDYKTHRARYDKEYNEIMTACRQTGKPDIHEIPGCLPPKPPKPPVKDYSDEEEDLVRRNDARKASQTETGLPIDPDGAVSPVRSGDSPYGLPDEMMEFIPAIRKAEGK